MSQIAASRARARRPGQQVESPPSVIAASSGTRNEISSGIALRNGLWSALANSAGAITGTLGSILIVRSLTTVEYGAFSYYVWLASILAACGTLALPNALTKISSELRGLGDEAEARNLARSVVRVAFGGNVLLGLAVLLWAGSQPGLQQPYLLIVAAVLLPNALAAFFRSTLWGQQRYRPVSVTAVVSALLVLPLLGLAQFAGWGGPGFLAATLSVGLVQCGGLVIVLWRTDSRGRLDDRLRWPRWSTWRHYLKFAVPATLVLFFDIVIWQRFGVLFLERFSGLEQVGFYSLAYTVFASFLALGAALVQGYYPAVSHDYGAGAWDRIRDRVQQALLLAALYAAPLSLGGWVTIRELVVLLYGEKMLPAVPVAQVLLLGLLPGVCAAVLGLTLSAIGAIWIYVPLGLALAILNVGLNLLLTPRLDALGAALASTGVQVAATVVPLFVVDRLHGIRPPWRTLSVLLVVATGSTLLLPLAIQTSLRGAVGLAVSIVAAGCLYGLACWRLGYLERLGMLRSRA